MKSFSVLVFLLSVDAMAAGGVLETPSCTDHFEGEAGTITSPEGDHGEYPNEARCQWTIRVAEGYVVKLKFVSIEIEEGDKCEFDRVLLYDTTEGGSAPDYLHTELLLGRRSFCGFEAFSPITSLTNHVGVAFQSDYSEAYAGFRLEWTAVVKNMEGPFDCTFDFGLCLGWQNLIVPTDDFDWMLQRRRTETAGTGPSHDHTLNNGNGQYMYIEASAPQRENDTAVLASPNITFPEGEERMCVTFWYHIYGSGIGALLVSQSSDNDEETLWLRSGSQGDKWLQGRVEPVYTTAPFQILFSGVRGKSTFGDIAIDDIAKQTGPCNGATEPEEPSSSGKGNSCPYQDDFKCDNGTCLAWWLQCNDVDDCQNGSDEQNCTDKSEGVTQDPLEEVFYTTDASDTMWLTTDDDYLVDSNDTVSTTTEASTTIEATSAGAETGVTRTAPMTLLTTQHHGVTVEQAAENTQQDDSTTQVANATRSTMNTTITEALYTTHHDDGSTRHVAGALQNAVQTTESIVDSTTQVKEASKQVSDTTKQAMETTQTFQGTKQQITKSPWTQDTSSITLTTPESEEAKTPSTSPSTFEEVVVVTSSMEIDERTQTEKLMNATKKQIIIGGGVSDGGETYSGVTDGGVTYSGVTDDGVTDGGVTNGGVRDDGVTDSGVTDGGVTDDGMTDGGVTDGSVTVGGVTDGGVTDGGVTDGGVTDGGVTGDGVTGDGVTGDGVTDGGVTNGGVRDGGVTDSGVTDGGVTDDGMTDGGVTDGGVTDGGVTDGGVTDGDVTDDGMTNGVVTDGGVTDGGVTDSSVTDDGMTDNGMTDGGTTDDGVTIGGVTEFMTRLPSVSSTEELEREPDATTSMQGSTAASFQFIPSSILLFATVVPMLFTGWMSKA